MRNNLTHNDLDIVCIAGITYSQLDEHPEVRQRALDEAAYLLALTIHEDEWFDILSVWSKVFARKWFYSDVIFLLQRDLTDRAKELLDEEKRTTNA